MDALGSVEDEDVSQAAWSAQRLPEANVMTPKQVY